MRRCSRKFSCLKRPHGGVADAREPASHVSDLYRQRTNGEGARRLGMAGAASSQSLKCCRSSLETRLRPRRLDSALFGLKVLLMLAADVEDRFLNREFVRLGVSRRLHSSPRFLNAWRMPIRYIR